MTWEVALAYIRIRFHAENSLTLVIPSSLHRLLRHRALRMIPYSSNSMHYFWLLQLLAWALLVKHLWGNIYFRYEPQVPLRPLFPCQVFLGKKFYNLLISLIFTASSSYLEHLWDLNRSICHLLFGIIHGLLMVIVCCLRFRYLLILLLLLLRCLLLLNLVDILFLR
jgi:hypothetical protein